jgi:hypothetical protein
MMLGLENVIHEPTRITSSSSTLIDPILVNNYDIVRDSYVLVYISTLIQIFYYLQKFLNKQIQLRVLLDQVYACLVTYYEYK